MARLFDDPRSFRSTIMPCERSPGKTAHGRRQTTRANSILSTTTQASITSHGTIPEAPPYTVSSPRSPRRRLLKKRAEGGSNPASLPTIVDLPLEQATWIDSPTSAALLRRGVPPTRPVANATTPVVRPVADRSTPAPAPPPPKPASVPRAISRAPTFSTVGSDMFNLKSERLKVVTAIHTQAPVIDLVSPAESDGLPKSAVSKDGFISEWMSSVGDELDTPTQRAFMLHSISEFDDPGCSLSAAASREPSVAPETHLEGGTNQQVAGSGSGIPSAHGGDGPESSSAVQTEDLVAGDDRDDASDDGALTSFSLRTCSLNEVSALCAYCRHGVGTYCKLAGATRSVYVFLFSFIYPLRGSYGIQALFKLSTTCRRVVLSFSAGSSKPRLRGLLRCALWNWGAEGFLRQRLVPQFRRQREKLKGLRMTGHGDIMPRGVHCPEVTRFIAVCSVY